MSTDLTVSAASLAPAMTIQQALARHNLLREVAKELLRERHDFGVIPGTESKDGKPSRKVLFQPGAEKLCSFFGLRPVFLDAGGSTKDWQAGLFDIRMECVLLINARREWPEQGGLTGGKPEITGDVVATAVRSANSREKKYRRGARVCPVCNAATIIRSKFPKDNPKWWCGKRDGGCGQEFDADDPLIVEQSPTIDPLSAADLVNTLEGMAAKRALVAAVRLATNASDLFDAEDEPQPGESDETDGAGAGTTNRGRGGAPRATGTIDQEAWQKIKDWLDHHGLSQRLFLQHYNIDRPGQLPRAKEKEAYRLAKEGNSAWREPRPAPKGNGGGDRAGFEQLGRLRAELQRVGIAGDELAKLLTRYNVTRMEELTAAAADAILLELRDLAPTAAGGETGGAGELPW